MQNLLELKLGKIKMEFFVDLFSFNENDYPDTFLIESVNEYADKYVFVESDLFETYGKYRIFLDCREINLEKDILNIKYLKTCFKDKDKIEEWNYL